MKTEKTVTCHSDSYVYATAETKLKDSEIVAELIESVRHDMEMPKEIWNRGMGLLQKFQQLERDEEAAQDKAAFEEACRRG